MNTTAFTLAKRYFRTISSDSTMSWMIRICFIAISIGSFALALVHAIMHGYELEIHKKMQGVHAQITIQSRHNHLNEQAIISYAKTNIPEIAALSPTITQYGMVSAESTRTTPSLVMIKAIHPELERHTSCLEEKIILAPTVHTLSACVHTNAVLIGSSLAEQLGVSIGDPIEFVYSQDTQTVRKKIIMEQESLYIGGIFKTGIDEFDSGVIYCSYDLIHQLFPEEGTSHIHIKLHKEANEQAVIKKLESQLSVMAYSWRDLYPALVSALKLEKYAMFLILMLITLVASLNIVSLLFMLITQKRTHIALLYMLGATPSLVTHIFMYVATAIATSATTLGIAGALVTCFILNKYPFIELPDAYYVSQLPAVMDWPTIFLVFFTTIGISTLAIWISAQRTRNIRIADILRFER